MDSWQYQCCGSEFRVGDQVSWTVIWDQEPWLSSHLGDSYPSWSLEMDRSAPNMPPVARRGGLQVSLLSDAPAGAKVVIGIPREEHHHRTPEGASETTGRVLRIHEVHVTYRRGSDNSSQPVRGTATLSGGAGGYPLERGGAVDVGKPGTAHVRRNAHRTGGRRRRRTLIRRPTRFLRQGLPEPRFGLAE